MSEYAFTQDGVQSVRYDVIRVPFLKALAVIGSSFLKAESSLGTREVLANVLDKYIFLRRKSDFLRYNGP